MRKMRISDGAPARLRSRLLTPFAVAALVAAAASPGGAASPTAVTDLAAVPTDAGISVTGRVTFGGQGPVIVGQDAVGDSLAGPAGGSLGTDIENIQISQPQPGGALLVTWQMTGLPAETKGPVNYKWSFSVTGKGGETIWYFVDFIRSKIAPPGSPPTVWLYKCPDLSCDGTAFGYPGFSYDSPAAQIQITVPSELIGALPGSVISAWTQGNGPPLRALVATIDLDGATHDPYTVPTRSVLLGIAPAGTAPGDVVYTVEASLAPNSSFAGTINAPGNGSFDVWAKACFGTNCAAASVQVSA